MKSNDTWAIGVDLGGTKVEVAHVGSTGLLHRRLRRPTNVKEGPKAVSEEIIHLVRQLRDQADSPPIGLGVGLAGQIDPHEGTVIFAPNLYWHNVPFQSDLKRALGLPVVVTNDVRAATWGEWLHGAGKGCDDLVCVFIGTGIGGGIVSGGRMLAGCSNTAGELGHMTIDLHGPPCTCGQRGCLEALAGGWATEKIAQEAVALDPDAGAALVKLAGGSAGAVTAKTVSQGALAGDLLSLRLVEQVAQALIAGAVSIVNAFNPSRLILGGGVIEGLPDLVDQIDQGVRKRALPAATKPLQILRAELGNDAGVVGAAALAIRTFTSKEPGDGAAIGPNHNVQEGDQP
jgi:glucokinase